MSRSRLVPVSSAALLLASACIYNVTNREPLAPRIENADPSLVGVALAGTAHVDDAGEFRVDLAMTGRCEQRVTTYQQVKVWQKKSTSYLLANAITSGLLAYGGLAGGVVLTIEGYNEGIPLIAFAVVNGFNILRVTVFTKRERQRTTSKRLDEQNNPTTCPDLLAGRALDRTPPELVLTTPWGEQVRASVKNRAATFRVDWSRSGLDPLDGNSALSLAQSSFRFTASDGTGEFAWVPTAQDVEAALVAIGRATGTDPTSTVGEAPPLLVIEDLDTKGPLPAGRTVRTSLTISNKGRGGAYRVVATTKSSDPALHGLRYSFGKIGPGESITKYLDVTVPREHEDGKALVVVNVTEANDNIPDRYSEEVLIGHAGRPRLTVICAAAQGNNKVNQTATVDAGRQIHLRCSVTNNGDGPAVAAQVDAVLGDGIPKSSTTGDIDAGAKGVFDVLLMVPAGAKTGQAMILRASARETNFGDRSSWELPIEIGLMQICQPPIARDAYERKLADVRAMGLDKATLKAYEEQLVACLGD